MGFHNELAGQDLHAPSNLNVENNTGSTLSQLKVVKFNGLGTVLPQVTPITSFADAVAGVIQEDILTGKEGFITSVGFIYNCNTTGYSVGDTLYCDGNGDLTTSITAHKIGSVVAVSATQGVIWVTASGDKGADGLKILEVSVQADNGNTSWEAMGSFIFRGTTALGTPSKIWSAVDVNTTSMDVRVVDVTNGSAVVCTVTGITTGSAKLVDMGALSNLPTGRAIFEIQAQRTGGGTNKFRALSVEW